MKQLFFFILLLPFFASGQTLFSQLPVSTPDAGTSFLGLKNVSGSYTDYLFPAGLVGGGTVTSVGLSMPSVFSVSPTPITSSGTFSVVAVGGQAANKFYATPDGISGALGLRSIVSADLPAVGTPGTYGDATHIPTITVDAFGRITAATANPLGSIALIVGQGDQFHVTGGTGISPYTAPSTTTVVFFGYITITAIVTDVIFYQIQWTDENGVIQNIFSPHLSTTGYGNIGPHILRVRAGTSVFFGTGFVTSGGTINYDIGWKIIQ